MQLSSSVPQTNFRIFLAITSGTMMGCSYPPFETGVFAAAAFIPIFILFSDVESYRETFLYAYLTFFIVNLITLYWTGGFTHAKDMYLMLAGSMLLIAHPLFFCVPFLVWTALRKQFGFKVAVYAFPFIWVAFEYWHAHTELSFPWLMLGNTQTYDLATIQFISCTGIYGVSFWLLLINVFLFSTYAKISVGDWKVSSMPTVLSVAGILVLYVLPKAYGSQVLGDMSPPTENMLRIGVVQPNIDPFEKWGQQTDPQLSTLQQLTEEVCKQRVELVLWPETALPFYVLHPANRPSLEKVRRQVDSLGIHLMTGIPDIVYYKAGELVPRSSKTSPGGERYDTFNSSMLLGPDTAEIQKYAKMLLVPFAERVPYSEELSFLNAMQWNFGMGGWNTGKNATVFRFRTGRGNEVAFSNLICYESIYPGFVANFVKKGAQFLTVITNDSWWGNTSGAYQHKQFALLRAVENRRWVVQCANGGISCFIDPFGHILQPTSMYTQTVLAGEVEARSGLTFYAEHGDWLAEVCCILSVFLLAAAWSKKIYVNIRRRQSE